MFAAELYIPCDVARQSSGALHLASCVSVVVALEDVSWRVKMLLEGLLPNDRSHSLLSF
jgi:hypothetical protein